LLVIQWLLLGTLGVSGSQYVVIWARKAARKGWKDEGPGAPGAGN
jgi:hypothetical protein